MGAPLRSATTSATVPLIKSTSVAMAPFSSVLAWPLVVGIEVDKSPASRRSISFLAFAMF